jgi:hypothetical protein
MSLRAATVAPQAAKPRSGLSGMWILGLACGLLATLATPTAILAGLLLAPGALAWLFDREPGRPAARPVLLCGMAAAIHPLVSLWTLGQTVPNALALAGDLSSLALAWAAQASGWLASEVVPLAATLLAEAGARARARRLRNERTALEEEWGLPPAGPSPTAAAKIA